MEKTELVLTLSTTDTWILLTHPLGAKNKSQPPLKESQRIARAEGKCSRHKGWWLKGKDKLATHSMTTEVWISTRGRISEATRIALQEALEEDNKKDAPSFGREDQDQGSPWRPLNEQADRWANQGRQSENIRWSLPSNRPIFYWTDNGVTHRSPVNPTVQKRINLQVSQ